MLAAQADQLLAISKRPASKAAVTASRRTPAPPLASRSTARLIALATGRGLLYSVRLSTTTATVTFNPHTDITLPGPAGVLTSVPTWI